jgi:hypothetical protein
MSKIFGQRNAKKISQKIVIPQAWYNGIFDKIPYFKGNTRFMNHKNGNKMIIRIQ